MTVPHNRDWEMSFEVTCISVSAIFLVNFLVQWITCQTEISGSNTAGTFVYVNAIHSENNKFPKIVTFSAFFNLFSCKNIISLKKTLH